MTDADDRRVLFPVLLKSVRDLIMRFVVLPGPEYEIAIALWIAHAHAIEAATTSPRLIFKSPEKMSGKTRALEVIETLVPAPVATVNASPAAIFRLLAEERATLLFDEVDAIFNPKAANQHEDLRALLNAGHRKGATVIRVVGDGKKMRVERFPVFAATALAAIGDLPETIESRAIVVPMRRRAPDEVIAPFRLRKLVAETDTLRDGLRRWAEAFGEELSETEPLIPAGISDRLAESWEPLLAIADLAGEPWASRARVAATKIAGGHVIDEASVGVQLLGDIRACLGANDRISSVNLLSRLNGLDEASWGGWSDGKGIKARDLARRLKPYGIKSRPLRPSGGGAPFKGYLRADFEDAWKRYPLPSAGMVSTVAELPELDSSNRATDVTHFTGGKGTAVTDGQDPRQRGHELFTHRGRSVSWWTRWDGEQVCGDCHPQPVVAAATGGSAP